MKSKKSINKFENSKINEMLPVTGGTTYSPRDNSGCYDTFDLTTKYPGGDTTQTPYYDMDNVEWWKAPGVPCISIK